MLRPLIVERAWKSTNVMHARHHPLEAYYVVLDAQPDEMREIMRNGIYQTFVMFGVSRGAVYMIAADRDARKLTILGEWHRPPQAGDLLNKAERP